MRWGEDRHKYRLDLWRIWTPILPLFKETHHLDNLCMSIWNTAKDLACMAEALECFIGSTDAIDDFTLTTRSALNDKIPRLSKTCFRRLAAGFSKNKLARIKIADIRFTEFGPKRDNIPRSTTAGPYVCTASGINQLAVWLIPQIAKLVDKKLYICEAGQWAFSKDIQRGSRSLDQQDSMEYLDDILTQDLQPTPSDTLSWLSYVQMVYCETLLQHKLFSLEMVCRLWKNLTHLRLETVLGNILHEVVLSIQPVQKIPAPKTLTLIL